MRLTLESDYAIRIVYVLACRRERTDAREISEESGVTLRFSLKILRKLVGADIVRSFKGSRGGYELAKEPSAVSVYDIIEVIEGPIHFSRCAASDFICTRVKEKPCAFGRGFEEISLLIRERLSAMTFDQFMEPVGTGMEKNTGDDSREGA